MLKEWMGQGFCVEIRVIDAGLAAEVTPDDSTASQGEVSSNSSASEAADVGSSVGEPTSLSGEPTEGSPAGPLQCSGRNKQGHPCKIHHSVCGFRNHADNIRLEGRCLWHGGSEPAIRFRLRQDRLRAEAKQRRAAI